MEFERNGLPIVVSAPSGGGKTTLCHEVMKRLSGIEFSVSYTTRAPRAQERNAIDYHFVDNATFDLMVEEDSFLEWARVHDHRYGTARASVEGRLREGADVLFDIDVQGGRQVLQRLPHVVLVFVVPPNLRILEERLRGRRSNDEAEVKARLEAARAEIEAARFYRYWIINDSLSRAVAELESVIVSHRLAAVEPQRIIAQLTAPR